MNSETEVETSNGALPQPVLGAIKSEDDDRGDESPRKSARRTTDAISLAIAKKKQGEAELLALRVTLAKQLAEVEEALGEGRVLTSVEKRAALRPPPIARFDHVIESETAAKAKANAKPGRPKAADGESHGAKVLEYLKSKDHHNAATGMTAATIGLATGLTPGQTASALRGLKDAVKSKGSRKARVWWAT